MGALREHIGLIGKSLGIFFHSLSIQGNTMHSNALRKFMHYNLRRTNTYNALKMISVKTQRQAKDLIPKMLKS